MQELVPVSSGELNFIFTYLSQQYLRDNGLNYQRINDIIGALECCKLKLYRRVVSPYEDNKIKVNGDVMILEENNLKESK